MNRSEALKISLWMLRKKGTIITGILLVMSFYWLYSGIAGFYSLYSEMAEKVYIHCNVPDGTADNLDKIGELDNVGYVTEYHESVHRLSFRGYYADVTLVGIDRQVLVERYADVLAASMNGNMPYVVVDASIKDRLENEKKEKIKDITQDDLLLQTVTLNGNDARICGMVNVLDEAKESDNSNDALETIYVYAAIEDYETLTGSLDKELPNDEFNNYRVSDERNKDVKKYINGDSEDAIDNQKNIQDKANVLTGYKSILEDTKIGGSSDNYYVEINSGFALEKTLETFRKLGISVQSQAEDGFFLERWKRELNIAGEYVTLYFALLVCGMMLLYYQKILWIKEHENFINYVKQGDKGVKTLKRVFRLRFIVCLVVGICGGGVIYLIINRYM